MKQMKKERIIVMNSLKAEIEIQSTRTKMKTYVRTNVHKN
jgi:hypothetical protein